jgi:hypothetical protein
MQRHSKLAVSYFWSYHSRGSLVQDEGAAPPYAPVALANPPTSGIASSSMKRIASGTRRAVRAGLDPVY